MVGAMTTGLGANERSAVWLLREERAGVKVRAEE
jgi:hypothetical protein